MTKANLHRFLQAEPRRSEERIKNGEDDTKLSKAAHYEGAVVFTAHFYVTVLGPYVLASLLRRKVFILGRQLLVVLVRRQ
jgi:hypothetical protein